MEPLGKNILITGVPGVGKTTLIKKLCDELRLFHPVGFYTAEIREKGVRKGFELIDLDGRKGLLSHVETKSRFRVGKYGVDVAGFDHFLDEIDFLNPRSQVIIIDEIGKMESFSGKFRGLVQKVLDSNKLVIAVIALKGGGIIPEVKQRHDSTIFEITIRNRDSFAGEILALLRR